MVLGTNGDNITGHDNRQLRHQNNRPFLYIQILTSGSLDQNLDPRVRIWIQARTESSGFKTEQSGSAECRTIGSVHHSVADPGCLSRIPGPTFFHPGSQIRTVSIPDPGSASKNLSILTIKMVSKL
jgi:hypothetical protein